MKKDAKYISYLLSGFVLITLCGCQKPVGSVPASETEITEETAEAEETKETTETEETEKEETPEDAPFQYENDPRDNPNAMKDIVVDPEAVYGFAPDPDSPRLGSYAEFDWHDKEFVEEAKQNRYAYHMSMVSMTDIIFEMREEGATTEEIARAVSAERNRLRMEAYDDNPEALENLKQSNLETYGNEDGPTPEQLYEKYGSWGLVVQKAFAPNLGMDAVCGLYDEFYWLYIELGLAEYNPPETENPNS